MDGVYLKQFLIAHSSINLSDCGDLFGDWSKWSELKTKEKIDFLSECQIAHVESLIKRMAK